MSAGRKARRERITAAFDAFHATVRDLLTAATRLSEGAARDHAETMVEFWLRREGLESARTDPGLQRRAGQPARRGGRGPGGRRRGRRLRRMARRRSPPARRPGGRPRPGGGRCGARLAPAGGRRQRARGSRRGAAAVADRHRPIGAGDGSGALPAPGAARFPVGVPLLDESHLQVDTRSRRWAGGRAGRAAGGGRGARRGAAAAGRRLLPAGAGVRARLGRRAAHRVAARALPADPHRPAHRARPGHLEGLLDELADRIRRVHTRVLVDGHPSLQALAREAQQRPEPWVVAVLVGDGTPLEDEEPVQRVLRGGPACGISLVLVDVPMTIGAPLETVRLHSVPDGTGQATVAVTSMTGPSRHRGARSAAAPQGRDPAPATRRRRARAAGARRVAHVRDLLPPDAGRPPRDSRKALCAPVGFVEGDARSSCCSPTPPRTRWSAARAGRARRTCCSP